MAEENKVNAKSLIISIAILIILGIIFTWTYLTFSEEKPISTEEYYCNMVNPCAGISSPTIACDTLIPDNSKWCERAGGVWTTR